MIETLVAIIVSLTVETLLAICIALNIVLFIGAIACPKGYIKTVFIRLCLANFLGGIVLCALFEHSQRV